MFKRTLLLAILALLVPGARPSLAQVEVRTVRVVAKQAEIRLQATSRSPLIGQAVQGTLLEVLSKEGDWYRIVVTAQVRLVPTAPAAGFVDSRAVEPLPPGDPRALGKPATPTGSAAARQAAKPAAKSPGLRVRAFGEVAYQQFEARDSFEAVFGGSSYPMYGGGIDFLLGRWFFVQVDATRMEQTGERVFVFGDEVFPLGIEQKVQVTPLAFSLGIRFGRNPRLIPYLGGGASICFYRESSPGSTDGTDQVVTEDTVGYQGTGGLEFRISRWIAAAAEGRYSYIPGILGDDGVSKHYNEKNLGGVSVAAKIVIGKR